MQRSQAYDPAGRGGAIVGGAAVGYIVSDLYNGIYTRTGIFVMMAIIGAGAVGLLDDWIKELKNLKIPVMNEKFSLERILSDPLEIRDW